MLANLVLMENPFSPAARDVRPLTEATAVAGLAPETDSPFICLYNGEPLLRADWPQTVVGDGDVVCFVVLPGDGGDSDPLRLVAMIAVMTFSAWAGPALAGAMGLTGVAAGAVGALATTGITMAGSMLVNAVFPAAAPPGAMSAMAAPSPTYSMQAQGNTARLGQPIPVQYGKVLAFPDFAAAPYTEYAGNEQYLYQLLCLGQGSYDIHSIKIEDTSIYNFDEVDVEIVGPGGSVVLFPADVTSSIEVAGQELESLAAVGPFTVCAAGSTVRHVAFDLVCPRGLYYAKDDGSLAARSVTVKHEVRKINELGAPVGAWTVLGTETITAATATAQRRSYRYAVDAGRYEARATRTDTKDESNRAGHVVVWAGLRGYHPSSGTYGNVTLIAVRMRATNNLSTQAARRINVTSTRKIKAWHPTTGWSAEAARRSIAWAIADAAKDPAYGLGVADSRLGLAGLYQLDQIWEARGDHFDGRFDTLQGFWDAVGLIARAGRARAYTQGGVLYAARDQAATLPVGIFTMRNIVRGSFSVEYEFPTEDSADCVDVEYWDETIWQPRTVRVALDGSPKLSPARRPLFGVINRAHAGREGLYEASCHAYRRTFYRWQTEKEGFIPTLLDLVGVSHPMFTRMVSGEVVDWDQQTLTATLSEPLDWQPVLAHYIVLRRRDGSGDGPYLCAAGVAENQVVFSEAPAFTPYTGSGEERTHFSWGPTEDHCHYGRVLDVRPRSLHRLEIVAVNEADEVHLADGGSVPVLEALPPLPGRYTAPVVTGLEVHQSGTPAAPRLEISWRPAANADHYLVETSVDGGNWWHRAAEPTVPSATIAVQVGEVMVRVAAVGLARGPWAVWNGTAGGGGAGIVLPALPARVTGVELLGQGNDTVFGGRDAHFTWRHSSSTNSWDLGSEPGGGDSGGLDAAAFVYDVRILNVDGSERRREQVFDNHYIYTLEANRNDGAGQAVRTFAIEVRQRGRDGQLSEPGRLQATNPQPDMSTMTPALTALVRGLRVDWSAIVPPDRDLEMYVVRIGTDSPPTEHEVSLSAARTSLDLIDLTPQVLHYAQVVPWDAFGPGAPSLVAGPVAPVAIPAVEIDLELSASIVWSDSLSTDPEVLADLYDRDLTTTVVSFPAGGWVQAWSPIEDYVDRVVVYATGTDMRCYVSYSADGVNWTWLRAEADHTLTATGELIEAADEGTATVNYWQLAAGRNVAIFPARATARYKRLHLVDSGFSVALQELQFVRQIIAEEAAIETLSAITANLGSIRAGEMMSADWSASNGVHFDLNNKRLRFGGSSAPLLDVTTTGLTISYGSSALRLTGTGMGYFSGGAWQSYFAPNGDMRLGGASGPFAWTAATSTLTLGTVASGKYAQWTPAGGLVIQGKVQSADGLTWLDLLAGGSNKFINLRAGGEDVFWIKADGTGYLKYELLGPMRSQQFTSNGTYTVPAGITKVFVTLVGGGGGGGGGRYGDARHGAGGGGGGAVLARYLVYGLTPGEQIAVTVGAGGAAGIGGKLSGSPAGNPGGNGGATIFGAYVSAGGGYGGGAGEQFTYGAGGAAGGAGGGAGGRGGDDNPMENGQNGQNAWAKQGGLGGALTSTTSAGGGGGGANSWSGDGARGGSLNYDYNNGPGNGANAAGYGRGGGGACGYYSGAGRDGGAGSPGYCLVEW